MPPFEPSCIPWTITKVNKPLMAFFREWGMSTWMISSNRMSSTTLGLLSLMDSLRNHAFLPISRIAKATGGVPELSTSHFIVKNFCKEAVTINMSACHLSYFIRKINTASPTLLQALQQEQKALAEDYHHVPILK